MDMDMDMDMVLGATSPGDCPQTDAAQRVGEKLWRCTGPGTMAHWPVVSTCRSQTAVAPSQLTAYINTGNILRWTTFTRIFPGLPSRRELFMHVCMTCVYV